MLGQLLLVKGPGVGIWIVRIFFLMAVITPVLRLLDENINGNFLFFSFLIAGWVMYEMAVYWVGICLQPSLSKSCNIFLFSTIAYGFVFLLGLRMLKMKRKQYEKFIFVAYSIFILLYILLNINHNVIVLTQIYKKPPRIYYLSYALAVSSTLIYFSRYSHLFDRFKKNIFLQFIGRSTLWIYLWHWFTLRVCSFLFFNTHVIFKFFFVYISAVLITYMQAKIVDFIHKFVDIDSSKYKIFRLIFTG